MGEAQEQRINHAALKYPYCIVWTPIPVLTWLFPFLGHMGIATSDGIIRDFAGSFYVGKDRMAFGNPTKYWQLSPEKALSSWDAAVAGASDEYQTRIHNLCCDNCHSMVALALNLMKYDNSTTWNMVKLAVLMLFHGKYVSIWAYVKTNLPFLIFYSVFIICIFHNELGF